MSNPAYLWLTDELENIEIRYESIQWKYVDGNIIFKDSWNERVVAYAENRKDRSLRCFDIDI